MRHTLQGHLFWGRHGCLTFQPASRRARRAAATLGVPPLPLPKRGQAVVVTASVSARASAREMWLDRCMMRADRAALWRERAAACLNPRAAATKRPASGRWCGLDDSGDVSGGGSGHPPLYCMCPIMPSDLTLPAPSQDAEQDALLITAAHVL